MLIIIFFFFIIINISVAQINERVVSTAIYKIELTKGNSLIINDSCKLTISKSYSYFFSLGKLAMDEKNIKIIKSGGDIQPCATCYQNVYYKNYSQNKIYRIAPLLDGKYAYPIDSIISINWVLQNDSVMINGVKCIKAIGKLNAEIYTAWFAPSIPVSDGPTFLKGLPGLILKCETTNGVKMSLLSFSQSYNTNVENKLGYPFIFTSYVEFKTVEQHLKEEMNSGRAIPLNGGNGTIRKLN
ncbi:MAG: GLPGLI family protein [Bacteroidetes bacterium]|nr:GLPGLI family protein [Bacteroidota bacterium]MBS1648065.1 GLPGLI family protein [Bacteroidota bacterium]